MSGSRYLLDTNAIVALLQGNSQLVELLQTADWVGISVISQIEFLAFSRLSQTDRQLFQQFLRRVTALGLTADETLLIQRTVEIRQQSRLKLPDAMIAAMAIENSASLITADREFAKVRDLTIIDW
jgi:tRNA(fMet)-specific endonuclease VapC